MASLTLEVEHGLDAARAKQAAELALTYYLDRYSSRGLRASWSSDTRVDVSLEIRGARLSGNIEILPSTLRVTADVPMLLRPFRSAASAAIQRETLRWVDRVRNQG